MHYYYSGNYKKKNILYHQNSLVFYYVFIAIYHNDFTDMTRPHYVATHRNMLNGTTGEDVEGSVPGRI